MHLRPPWVVPSRCPTCLALRPTTSLPSLHVMLGPLVAAPGCGQLSLGLFSLAGCPALLVVSALVRLATVVVVLASALVPFLLPWSWLSAQSGQVVQMHSCPAPAGALLPAAFG